MLYHYYITIIKREYMTMFFLTSGIITLKFPYLSTSYCPITFNDGREKWSLLVY